MGQLIKAEFRKIWTTSLWWALMIPTVAVAFGWALVTGLLGDAFLDLFSTAEGAELERIMGFDSGQWKLSYFAFARSIDIATVFPLIFGGLAIASESSNKTLTTTFLTAPNRTMALAAKAIVYVAWGAIFGAAISLSVTLGLMASTGFDFARLPTAGGWLAMFAIGVLATVLMTLFGVGVGALVRNVAGTVTLLTLYFLIIENIVQVLLGFQYPPMMGFLPNGSVNGITGSLAADLFFTGIDTVPSYAVDTARALAGAFGAQPWWLSSLIFVGWAGVVFGGGWAMTQKRDIT